MLKKLFRPIQAGSATAIIGFASLLSYILGLVRDRVIAGHFGTNHQTDAFNTAALLPDLLLNLFIAGALSAAFLPVLSGYLTKDKEKADELSNTMLTTVSLWIVLLSTLSFIFMEQIIHFLYSTEALDTQIDIIKMGRIMSFAAILFAISNTIGNILIGHRQFLTYALAPALHNLGIIFGIFMFESELGIYSAAIGFLIGSILHCTIRIFELFSTPYRFRPQLKLRHPGFIKILKLMIPKSLSLIAWPINLIIISKVALELGEGGYSAFNYARNIQSFPVSLIGISFASAIFPFLTTKIAEEDKTGYTENIQKTIQRILFFTIPAAVGMAILAKPIVTLILGGGAFGTESIAITSTILIFFALSIPFESLSHIFARAFYALKNTITPMIVNLISMLAMAIIVLVFAPKFGIQWFSIAFSIGFIIYNILIFAALRKHLHNFKGKEFLLSISKTIFASAVMAAIVHFSSPLSEFVDPRIATAIQITLGGLSFFAITLFLKSPEIDSVNYILKRLTGRK